MCFIVALLLCGCKHSVQNDVDSEQDEPVIDSLIILKYDEPINGYNAMIEWKPKTSEAEFFFTKEGESFSVKPWSFKPEWFNMAIDGNTLHYRPKPEIEILDPEEPFFFQDIDYDGVDELLVVEIQGGPRGSNAYRVFELDGTEREDEPFYEISDWTSFNPSEKSITLSYNYGVLIGGYRMKYKHLKDGVFVVTDSIHVEYKADYSDSIRTYYRKQGDKMVFVKKEIVK